MADAGPDARSGSVAGTGAGPESRGRESTSEAQSRSGTGGRGATTGIGRQESTPEAASQR